MILVREFYFNISLKKSGFVLSLLLAGCLLSCDDKKIRSSERVFHELQGYQIDLDQFTSPVEDYVQYVGDWKGQEAFAFHVRKKEEIKVYGLKDGQLVESLSYRNGPPNPLQGIYDFHILNTDSIFLNKRYHYKTYLVNADYQVLKEFGFLEDDIELDRTSGIPLAGDTFLPVFNHNRLFRKVGNRVYLTGSPDKDAKNPAYFDSNNLMVSVDLQSGGFRPVLGYPEGMKNHGWGPLHSNLYSDYSVEGRYFVLSYEADGLLYLADTSLKIVREFEAVPDHYAPIRAISVSAQSGEEAYLAHFNDQFRFGSVLYDSYRNLIYRIALEPDPDYGKVFLRDPLYKPRNIIAMAFDAGSFEKIAEIRLEQDDEGVYLDRCFVNDRGLNIAYVDLADEDRLYFKTFLVE